MTPRRAAALAALASLLPMALAGDAGAPAGEIAPTATDIRPLRVGAPVPDVALRQVDGRGTTLAEQLGDSAALVIFYRGGW